jgi:hypothetical protein
MAILLKIVHKKAQNETTYENYRTNPPLAIRSRRTGNSLGADACQSGRPPSASSALAFNEMQQATAISLKIVHKKAQKRTTIHKNYRTNPKTRRGSSPHRQPQPTLRRLLN